MWVRKRIDIGWPDLALGILACCRPQNGPAIQRQVEQHWSAAGDTLACLSVRSGFDLLLAALNLPPKSEVLITALTIPDMVRIIKDHDLVPVPVDVELDTMAPQMELLRRAITPATRAIVVAHLFGGRVPLEPILALVRQHQLLVIEDCAQAYAAGEYRGHPEADVSMFSFGPIKTATALGGAVLRVHDREVLRRMRAQQDAYPRQSRWRYLRRLLKYALLKAVSPRPVFKLVVYGCRVAHRDYDRMLNAAVRGFPGPGFMQRIRQRPSPPLLALLKRRLRRYKTKRLAKRTANGELLARYLRRHVPCPGADCLGHTHWVFPIVADSPSRVMAALRAAGFDATQGQSMCVVPPPGDRAELRACLADDTLARIVFLPIYADMPARAVRKMARAVLRAARERPAALGSERREQVICPDERAPLAPHVTAVSPSTNRPVSPAG
jgi:dTDP-4-amino-4,6-dideoxygalactose transaminase